MVLHPGRPHLTSLPMETVPGPCQASKAHHLRHATGTNPTSTDHKLSPQKAVTEELDAAVEVLAADLQAQADLETANGSMASTSQAHPTHV